MSGGPAGGNGGGAGNPGAPNPGNPGERISRDEMVKAHGAPGVQNPNVVDRIGPADTGDHVEVVMIEERPWRGYEQLRQLEEKINRYLGYVLDGYLGEHYPQYIGLPVTICLETQHHPEGEVIEFLQEARRAIEGEGLRFVVRQPS